MENQNSVFEKFHTLSIEEAEGLLGNAIEEERFILNDLLPEFRIELYNHFDQEQIESQSIEIFEKSWKLDNENMVTVWYQRNQDSWQFVHKMTWKAGKEF